MYAYLYKRGCEFLCSDTENVYINSILFYIFQNLQIFANANTIKYVSNDNPEYLRNNLGNTPQSTATSSMMLKIFPHLRMLIFYSCFKAFYKSLNLEHSNKYFTT